MVRKLTLYLLFALALSISSCTGNNEESDISIIPEPLNIKTDTQGHFEFTTATRYSCSEKEWLPVIKDFANIFTQSAGFTPAEAQEGEKADIIISSDKEIEEEGYTLSINRNNINIKASTQKGVFYALQTLRQMLPVEIESKQPVNVTKWEVPCAEIKDNPRFEYRGFMLDVSRYFIPKETVLKMLDFASMLKINRFHMHLVDDQGWRIEIKKYPKLTEKGAWRVYREGTFSLRKNPLKDGEPATVGGFYTQEDIREIVEYAAARQIEVIPEIEMPAHTNSSLAAYPQYMCPSVKHYTAVLPGMGGVNFNSEYCAGNDETFKFLQDIIDEVIQLFPSRYIHLGGDEANKEAWKTCPKCQKRMKKLGITDLEDLQGYFMGRMADYVRSKGKIPVGWDELTNAKIPEGTVILGWRGDGQAGYKAAKEGHQFIMSPSHKLYLSYYQGPQWFEPRAYFGNSTLKDVYEYEPIQPSWEPEAAKKLIGVQASLWCEFIESPKQVEYMLFPRLAALADIAWTQQGTKNWAGFIHRLDRLTARWDYMGLNYSKSMFNIDHKVTPVNNKLSVKLSCIRPDVEIRYTTDGKEPTAQSELFKDSIVVSQKTDIKAATFINGIRKGKILTLPIIWNKATAKPVTGSNDCNLLLTNGVKGSDKHTDFEWAGWYDQDVTFTLDLQEQTDINNVRLGHAVNYGMGVHYPKSVKLYISDDNKDFRLVSEISYNEKQIFADGIYTDEISFNNLNQKGRFLKFDIKSAGKTPQFHHRAGQGIWLRFDEIEVF